MEHPKTLPEVLTKVKVGIIGPKEVGKTALANLLNGHLKSRGVSSDLVHESARYSPLPLNKKTSFHSAYWLFGMQIASEALVSATRQFTICDRTVIDLFPFAQYSLTEGKWNDEQKLDNSHKLQSLKMLISDYITAQPYNFLFYVPIRQELRTTNSSLEEHYFQIAIDERLRKFLQELKIDYYELQTPSTYDRLSEINSYIKIP
jgi:GTPase SAR1 family protein